MVLPGGGLLIMWKISSNLYLSILYLCVCTSTKPVPSEHTSYFLWAVKVSDDFIISSVWSDQFLADLFFCLTASRPARCRWSDHHSLSLFQVIVSLTAGSAQHPFIKQPIKRGSPDDITSGSPCCMIAVAMPTGWGYSCMWVWSCVF